MVSYSTLELKWKAYQFLDPFARGKFFVCNKGTKVFCTPECDSRYIPDSKANIEFVHHSSDALKLLYQPCEFCEPTSPALIDSAQLIECVSSVNRGIGFISPLLEQDEVTTQQKIKRDLIQKESKTDVNDELAFKLNEPTVDVLKNDAEHYKLVDLACRHLALAAATTILKPTVSSPRLPRDDSQSKTDKKRKRRGGVLGFKELAAKLKLSAWHFHRVFKSVTGVTPKNYGDKCSDYFKVLDMNNELATPVSASELYPTSEPTDSRRGSTDNLSPYETPLSLVEDFEAASPKKLKVTPSLPELEEPQISSLNMFPYSEPIPALQDFDFQFEPYNEPVLSTNFNTGFENSMFPDINPTQFDDIFQIPNQFSYSYDTLKQIVDQLKIHNPGYLLG